MTPLQALNKYFGYNSFRPAQEAVIKGLIEDKQHTLLLMPTGGGKSLCYQIPALIFSGGTIVISPLIALMQDQVEALKQKGIPAAYINSTVSASDKEKRLSQFVCGKLKLLYVTPERFRKKEFVDEITKANISLLAIDEAHCISEWGHDFRPDYSRIAEFRELLHNPLTIALTATATKNVQNDIIVKAGLQKQEVRIYHEGIKRKNLRLEAVEVFDEKETIEEITKVLESTSGSGIIYFALVKKLEQFSEILSAKGYKHNIYHGKLEPQRRKRVQREFINGDSKLMLATNAFGMGIDKSDIRFIIHVEVPSSVESYYQEIGRAGRDGNDSVCKLIYNQDDLYTQMEFIKWANPDSNYYRSVYELLKNRNEEANAMGVDFLREEMSFKDRNDFRVETVLNMLDRYSVTEGDIEDKNIRIVAGLPSELTDDREMKEKLLNDNKQLLAMVNYFRTETCRRIYISDYFGFKDEKPCKNCDVCSENEE